MKVSGRYRGDRFDTTITDRRLVRTLALRRFRNSLRAATTAARGLGSAMGKASEEIAVFVEYARLPKGPS